jgi:hypothetical protein
MPERISDKNGFGASLFGILAMVADVVLMAYRMNVELLFSEVELQVIREYDLNVPEICVNAVKDAIDSRNIMRCAVLHVEASHEENINLRREVERLTKEIQRKEHPVIEMTFIKRPFSGRDAMDRTPKKNR